MGHMLYKISIIIYISLGYTGGLLPELEDLKIIPTRNIPVIVIKPGGGYAVIWEELGEAPEIGLQPRYYYYQLFGPKGEKITEKEEFIDWRVPVNNARHYSVSFSPNSVLWVNSNNLLVIGWLDYYYFEGLRRIIIDKSGGIIKKDTLNIRKGAGSHLTLVKAKNGDVYLVETGYGYDWRARIMQVFPHIGKLNKVSAQNDILGQFVTQDNAVIITSNNKLLFCYRLKTKTDKPIWEAPDGWAGMPNQLVYFITDLDGDLIGEPIRIDLTKDAFRKIPGVHLGGIFSISRNTAFSDLDLSRVPNGEIILSATGKDEKGNLCVYQVKFNQKGKLLTSNEPPQVIKPRDFPKDLSLPVMKIIPASVELEIRGEQSIGKTEYVLFGFDEDGNFYEEREVWKVNGE